MSQFTRNQFLQLQLKTYHVPRQILDTKAVKNGTTRQVANYLEKQKAEGWPTSVSIRSRRKRTTYAEAFAKREARRMRDQQFRQGHKGK